MLQYIDIKEKNMDVILFFRLGDFYEMFFEDAYIASKELELTLTGKNAGLDERIPMCGITMQRQFILRNWLKKGIRLRYVNRLKTLRLPRVLLKEK